MRKRPFLIVRYICSAIRKILVDEPQAPAGHLLQFEQQKANPDEHSIFSDPPSSEVDKAWDDLVRRMISGLLIFTPKG
jgi:hypothetical protein